MEDNKIVNFKTEEVKINAFEILREMKERHDKTGEYGIYDITPDGELGEKLHDL